MTQPQETCAPFLCMQVLHIGVAAVPPRLLNKLPHLSCLTLLDLRIEKLRSTDIEYVNGDLARALAQMTQLCALQVDLSGMFNSDRSLALQGIEDEVDQFRLAAQSMRLAGALSALTGAQCSCSRFAVHEHACCHQHWLVRARLGHINKAGSVSSQHLHSSSAHGDGPQCLPEHCWPSSPPKLQSATAHRALNHVS